MLDADSKLYSHAHVAGLKRLSARASAGPALPGTRRNVVFSFSNYGRTVIANLKAHNVQIASPLSEEEFERIEATFKFSFPPDLRGILREGLPVGAGFPDWRNGGSQQLRMWVKLPMVGICQAVERGSFWWKGWGPQPKDLDQAAIVARAALKKAPILLPVYGHCYIPTSPNRAGNPLFFIHQLEAFYCGFDVADFFQQELFVLRDHKLPFQLPSLGSSAGKELGSRSASTLGSDKFARFEKSHGGGKGQVGSFGRVRSVSGRLDSGEWNWERSVRDAEAWGRNLDPLARHSGVFGRNSEVSSLSEHEQRFSKSSVSSASSGDHTSWESLDEIPTHKFYSSEALSSTSMISNNESGKAVRRIEFWTDFVEKRQLRSAAALPAHIVAEPIFEEEEDDKMTEFQSSIVPKCLERILDDVSTQLRSGGWKEDDISEIVDASSLTSGGRIQPLDRQSVLEGLALQLDFLSASLRKAGWSVQDVAETISFDLALYERQRKPRLKLTPELAARIGPLAAYAAKA
ncbi:hypothetical protein O6H91_02G083800 [Diphasiastrum complanatum]|uniref:Uncharacterized protein n=2 Tax=Diphasiastrum complanatum TaxID=34168 RepID=A0ACC2EHL8_DIPCM|nr:hypothetical protein O6H91_02G083800 [Diphasiastrum complanatum]KAJ7565981.1 hypothetical protein O6H91_02G083800 [Diphasiastrum complanatum]